MTQHTHDEVIAWTIRLDERIDLAIKLLESKIAQPDNFGLVEILNTLRESKAGNLANRAGLERHKPDESFDEPRIVSPCCKECSQEYENGNYIFHPCPSYTEIYNPIVSVM